jgi:hypothetical protein
MPYVGSRRTANGECSCHKFQEVDAHLLGDGEGDGEARKNAFSASGASVFCPGATQSQYAPDLLLEPTHLDITLHVDLEQQCMVVDEVITVKLNVPSKSNAYSITLDGIGFQHLHASRLSTNTPLSSQPSSPRKDSTTPKVSLDFSRDSVSQSEPSSSRGLFGFLRPFDRKTSPAPPSKSPPAPSSTPSPGPTDEVRDTTAFYCTYDGRKINLSWIGPEAFHNGSIGAVEKVRLIYLVDKPITGLHFTKPPTEVELEMIDQQQKPLVSSSYAAPKKSDSGERKRVAIPASPARVSPFHSSRPTLACTDHETERARYWLATIDQPCVRPTAKYTFIIKAGLSAIANGELLPSSVIDATNATTTSVPVWPLSLFNPPINRPKAPTYARSMFVWNNPYPTASYLACFAVGQLHYIEAIPPRHFPSALHQAGGVPSSSKATSSSSSISSHQGHKRTMSQDSGKSQLLSSSSNDHLSGSTSLDDSSVFVPPRSSSQRLSMISEGLESSPEISIPFTTLLESQQETPRDVDDRAHHKKTAKKREEAAWILKDIPMRYYTPRNIPLTTVQLMLSRTPEIMKWLQGRLGLPFPFPAKYYQFVAPELPSAMENITLTTWGSDYLLNSVWALEYGLSTESINVHEMAHSYFGNSTGIKFWEHAWLKEGWANYVECLWQEDKYGDDALAYMLWRNGKLYMKECENLYTRPIVTNVYDSSWDLYDQHLYRGGSRRIHSLRCLLGDDVFWPAVTDYLRTYSAKLVDSDDFQKILEKHAHRNLSQFFKQWIYSPGYPKIFATYEYSPARQQISISAKQTQMDEKLGIPTFALSIPIDIAYVAAANSNLSSGASNPAVTTTTTANSSSKVKWIKTALVFSDGSPDAHLTIHVPSPPVQIIIDKKLSSIFSLSMDPGFTVLRTMALHCWSVPHRIWAAQCLLERGAPQELEVISEMLLNRETHWGVIADVAVLLAKPHRAQQAARILCKLLLSPSSHPAHQPRALMSIALALGMIRDPRIPISIRQFLAIKKYTNIHRIDEVQLRSISSWSSLSSLAEAAEQLPPPEKKSRNRATSTGSSGSSDSEDGQLPRSSTSASSLSSSSSSSQAMLKEKKEDGSVNMDITIPYKTHGRLLESLAAQGDANDENLIIEQAERTRYGWLGITRGSALMALAEYGTASAFDYILDATRISEHQHLKARSTAVVALAQCVHKAKMSPPILSRALHTLYILLHDLAYSIRFSAVHALFKLIPNMGSQAAEALSQIHHIRKTLSNQDRMWLKRKRLLIKGEGKIRKASKGNISKSSIPGALNNVATATVPSPGPSMDEFLALKAELSSLKSRIKNIEQQLEDSDDDGK